MGLLRRIAMAAAIAAWVTPAYGQLVVPGAGNDKFGLIDGDRSLSVSTADDGVSFNWSTAKYKTVGECNQLEPHSDALFECLDTLTNAPWSFEFSLGITGEKGKGSLVSKGLFSPGASFSAGISYRLERPNSGIGTVVSTGTLAASTNPLHVATFPMAGEATIEDGSGERGGDARWREPLFQ